MERKLARTASTYCLLAALTSSCAPNVSQTESDAGSEEVDSGTAGADAGNPDAATHTLTVVKVGSGSGTVTGAGIDCGADCTETVAWGTSIALSASPGNGSAFGGWSGGGCTGNATCQVAIFSAVTVTATFNLIPSGPVFYVRQGASGNGSDWSNAYGALPATLARGATYYIASGTYGSYRFNDAQSGTDLISIKKATPTDHGTNTGWDPAYGSGQAVWNGPLHFDTSYWVFDGQTRNESDWFSGADYGFKIFHDGNDQQIRMSTLGTAVSYVVIKHTYLEALNTPLPNTTIRRYGLDIDTFGGTGTSRGLVVSRSFFQYGNVPIFTRDNDGMILEYSAFDANDSNGANHGEAMSAYYTNHRFIIRFNKFRATSGTAVIAFTTGSSTPADGFEIYGNVIWNADIGDGIFGFDRQEWPFTNTKIFNNTIVDKVGGFSNGIAIRSGSNNQVFNNLWVNTASSFWNGTGATYNYNAYSWDVTESNAQTNVPPSIFTNYAADNFTLGSPTAPGTTLPAPYNVDMFGNVRGGDGSWDRGAYEFVQ